MSAAKKTVMLYHRSYRIIDGSVWVVLLQILLLVLPISLGSVFFYPEITNALCQLAHDILSPHYPTGSIYVAEAQFISFLDDYSYLHLPSTYPTYTFSLINAIVCILLLILLPRIEIGKPFLIFILMVAFIHLSSALFFLIAPDKFPYDTTEYSRLYILQQISIGFFVPLIMGMAVMPLPSPLILRCLVVWSTYFYSLLFNFLRYIVFLYLLDVSSLLFMAVLYFIMGPLVDFVYITGIYSLFLSGVAKDMRGDSGAWRW